MSIRMILSALLALLWCGAPHASATDSLAANETIWPSQNDIAQTAGDGKKILENQWAKPAIALFPNNYTLSGLTVPGTSANLTISVASGTALIAGRHITIPAGTTVTAAASNVNYVFLKMTRDGASLATGVSFEVNTTAIPPADSTPIATLTAGASTITATSDLRVYPTNITSLTSGANWTVPAGVSLIAVEIFGASGGGGGGASAVQNGTAGGAGGTTTFNTVSATGGGGGPPGTVTTTSDGAAGAAHGAGSGGQVNNPGRGFPGGTGGGGSKMASNVSESGRTGGHGGYASLLMSVTPGTDITYAIGAAGTAGARGDGGATQKGAAGNAGIAGKIVIHY